MPDDPREPDPLLAADTLAERLIAAVTPRMLPTITQRTTDARNARALAAAVSALALVSMARDVRRVVDLADQFWFDDDDDEVQAQ